MKRSRQKRIADISEKLGVGFFIAASLRVFFEKAISGNYWGTIAIFALGIVLMIFSIFLSREE